MKLSPLCNLVVYIPFFLTPYVHMLICVSYTNIKIWYILQLQEASKYGHLYQQTSLDNTDIKRTEDDRFSPQSDNRYLCTHCVRFMSRSRPREYFMALEILPKKVTIMMQFQWHGFTQRVKLLPKSAPRTLLVAFSQPSSVSISIFYIKENISEQA